MNNNTLFLICGESGSGKTTLVSALEKQHNLIPIPSYTTRPPRSENEYGHIFVNDEAFSQLKNIVAYTQYNNCQYGATSEQVDKYNLYIIDKEGIEFFKKAYRGKKSIKVIYIKSSISTRVERMEQRFIKDSNLDIEHLSSQDINSIFINFGKIMERITTDDREFAGIQSLADKIIENQNNTPFQDVVRQAYEFIRKENASE